MFDLIKNNKRLAQIVLALLTIPFAFFGLESYTRSMRGADEVARIDGVPIKTREFTEELRRQQERMRQLVGRGFDPSSLDTPEARLALLESLVTQQLMASAAAQGRLLVGDEVLSAAIAAVPAFQRDGKFSMAVYEAVLRSQGMTPQMFEARMRYDLSVGQLARAVAETAIPSRTVAERLAQLESQRREVAVAALPSQPYLAQAKVDEAKVKAYYDANPAEFRAPERLRAEYVVLQADEIGKQEPVSEAELRALYDSRAAQYQVGEQRRASHILVKTKEEGEKVLAEVKKDPGRFAELAKKYSQDPGSAQRGGDLGFFGRGMMVKAFEDAVFRMKPGELSGVVESEFGLHVIRLTAIQPGKQRSFDEVRKELVAELQREKGARKFAEAAEGFSNMVYEQPDALRPVAERYKLKVQTTGWFARGAADLPSVLANPRLQGVLFSADSVKSRRNSDAVEVAPSTLVAARVIEHQPAAQRAYADVRAGIEQTLRRREADARARTEGQAKLEQLRKGGDAGLKWGPALLVSRADPQGLDPEGLRRVVAADVSKLPAYVGLPAVDDGGYLIYRISKVVEPARSDAQGVLALQRAERVAGAAQYEAYVASLRARADVEIRKENLERK